MRSSLLSLLFLCAFGVVQALSSSGNRLLVIIDDVAEKVRYSKFWEDLQGRGFTLSFRIPKSDPALFAHGELAHDHLLILPSRLKALGPALAGPILLDFMKSSGNILVALSADYPTPAALNALLLELDIQLPADRNTLVVDHFNYDAMSAAETHDVLLLPAPGPLRPDVKNYFGIAGGLIAVPRAVGQTLGNASPLLAPILRAPSTAYSYNTKEETGSVEDPFATGSQLTLISAMQARNSARLTVIGSAAMLEDTWFDATVSLNGKESKTANREFAARVAGWTFQELGVLKVGRVVHYLNEGSQASKVNESTSALSHMNLNPKMYRIKNDVTYTVTLSEYAWDHYQPFTVPSSDSLQLEFSMLSPYHRVPLRPSTQTTTTNTSPNATTFTAAFRLPDQHGIFNFRVNYKRPFLTNVDEKDTVTVRHFAHDEWPRSWAISGAWVWIVGVWGTVGAWVAFCAVWLFSEPVRAVKKGKKVQ